MNCSGLIARIEVLSVLIRVLLYFLTSSSGAQAAAAASEGISGPATASWQPRNALINGQSRLKIWQAMWMGGQQNIWASYLEFLGQGNRLHLNWCEVSLVVRGRIRGPMALAGLHLDVRGIPREVRDFEEGLIDVPNEIIVHWEFIGLLLDNNRFAIGLDFFNHQAQTGSPFRAPGNNLLEEAER